ncbi:MAG: VCBS domain-containing protein [Desulfovibrio sp.]|nr:VCBS domain-containing protein [Desulfovibrio sp.]
MTVTIRGTNDAPQVSAAAAAINEDQASVSGTLPVPADTDASDSLAYLPQTSAPGLYGTFTLLANGTYTYSLNNALAAVQQLGVGAQLDESFTYTVTDQHGATASNTITVTIRGTNDAPQVSAATAAINEDQASISGSLPTPTDIDTGDTVSFLPKTSSPGLYGIFNLLADGTYTYSLNNALPIVQQLGLGQQLTEIFTYVARDQHGDTSSSTLTITINGTNDNPVIAPIVTTTLKEDSILSSSGTLMVTDADLGDAAAFQAQNIAGLYGSFVLNSSGAYVYTLNNSLPFVQGLGQGEQLVESFTVAANDGHGGMAARTISFTINGTNDGPSVGPATAAMNNKVNLYTGTLPTPTDPDNSQDNITSDTLRFIPKTGESGNYGWFSLNADGSYSYTLNTGLLPVVFLVLGATLTDTFTYTVTDEHGATATNSLTMNISGGLLGSISLTAVVGDATNLLGNLLVPGFANPVFTLESSAEGEYGTLTLNSNGTYSYSLSTLGINESQKLGEGETATDVFMVRVTASGKSITTPLTITLTGTNDAPTVQQAYLSVSEDDVSVMYGQLVITDPDQSDTPQAIAQTTQGLFGTFYLNPNGSYSYVLNKGSADVTALNDGETLNDVFTVTVVDGHGGTAQTTVTVTINGAGEAPFMQGMGAMRLFFVPDDVDDPDNTAQNSAGTSAEENTYVTDEDIPTHPTPENATATDDPQTPPHTDAGQMSTNQPGVAQTNAGPADAPPPDTDNPAADSAHTAHPDDDFFIMLDDILDEELADSFMNDQTGPLIMDIGQVSLPQAQGLDADSFALTGPQHDTLFPMEPETLVDTGAVSSAAQPGQGQNEAESPQPQNDAKQQPTLAGMPSPEADITQSEADQMAVLQHLTQNGY